jgi:hypothetical protein
MAFGGCMRWTEDIISGSCKSYEAHMERYNISDEKIHIASKIADELQNM